jgi:hypothetical protein
MLSTMKKKPIKYGLLNDPGTVSKYVHTLKAAEVFYQQSGRFVARDGAGSNDVAVAGDTQLEGWAETFAHLTPASTGAITIPTGGIDSLIICDFNARFIMGCTGTYADSLRGKTCDLEIVSSRQYANENASATDVLVIYDGNADLSIVEVGLAPAKMFATGVA